MREHVFCVHFIHDSASNLHGVGLIVSVKTLGSAVDPLGSRLTSFDGCFSGHSVEYLATLIYRSLWSQF